MVYFLFINFKIFEKMKQICIKRREKKIIHVRIIDNFIYYLTFDNVIVRKKTLVLIFKSFISFFKKF